MIYTKVEAADWSDWFYMSYIFELKLIRFMHVIPVVENKKICKHMVDHFHWNEFERNAYPSNT